MLRLFKWIAGILLTLVLLIVVAVIAIPQVFEPNDYRQVITELVKEQTGRDLTLNGDLSVSVFPWLGIRTEQLMLSQPDQIGDTDGAMVLVKTAQLRIKLLPLLSKRVEVDTVVLEQPEVRIVTLANGISSFDGLVSASDEKMDSAISSKTATNSSAQAAVALVIQGLQLTDGRLDWDDKSTDQRYKINDFNLVTGNLLGQDLADIQSSGVVINTAQPDQISFTLDALARLDTQAQQVFIEQLQGDIEQGTITAQLKMNQLTLDQQQAGIVAQAQGIELETDIITDSNDNNQHRIELEADVQAVSFASLTQQLRLSSVTTEMEIQSPQQPELEANIAFPQLSFDLAASSLNLQKLTAVSEIADRPINASIPQAFVDMAAQTATLPSISLQSQDLSMTLSKLAINQLIDAPSAQGQLLVPSFNAAKLMRDLDMDYQPSDANALQSVELRSSFKVGLDHLSLSNLALLMDDSRLNGSFSAKNFNNPVVQFDLDLDRLNLDQYLPDKQSTEDASEPSPSSSADALVVPMAIFKDINANGQFKAQQLVSGGIELNNIDVQVVSVDGEVTITPKANLYDGSLAGSMAFSQQQNESNLRIKNNIDLVDLGQFFTAADVTDQLSGIGSLALDITVTERDGIQSNKGTIKLFAKNGALKGVDIKDIVDRGYQQYQQLKGQPTDVAVGNSDQNDETRFAELLGTFHLQDFQITNNDFNLKAPLFRVAGNGDINLEKQNIDYLVNVSIVNSSDGQGGEALEQLKGLTLPIRLKGSLLSPQYSLDMEALYKAMAEQKIQQKKGEYLAEELGIEGGEKLSSKAVLRELLSKKIDEEIQQEKPEEASSQVQPVAEIEPEQTSEQSSSQQVDDADTSQHNEQSKSAEEQLKEDLKQKLLDSLFN